MEEYKKCFLYDKNEVKCGPCKKKSGAPKTGVFHITELERDVAHHLQALHFQIQDDPQLHAWDERKLIENRLGRTIHDDSLICAYHRNEHGIGWKAKNHCAHRLHPEYKKGTKTKKTELAPMWLVNALNDEVPLSFPVGGKVCREHTLLHPRKKQVVENDDNVEVDVSTDEPADQSFLDQLY